MCSLFRGTNWDLGRKTSPEVTWSINGNAGGGGWWWSSKSDSLRDAAVKVLNKCAVWDTCVFDRQSQTHEQDSSPFWWTCSQPQTVRRKVFLLSDDPRRDRWLCLSLSREPLPCKLTVPTPGFSTLPRGTKCPHPTDVLSICSSKTVFSWGWKDPSVTHSFLFFFFLVLFQGILKICPKLTLLDKSRCSLQECKWCTVRRSHLFLSRDISKFRLNTGPKRRQSCW